MEQRSHGAVARNERAVSAPQAAPICYDGGVFFRRPAPEGPRAEPWRAFAARLELRDASDRAERIRRWLDLEGAELHPVYLLRREGLPSVYVFDALRQRRGPSGVVRQLRSYCLVRSEEVIARHVFRALPRQDKVLESLHASRSGAVRVEFPRDAAFDGAVSVYAREADGAAALLTAPVRGVLRRLLAERGLADASVVVGERHVVSSFASGEDPALVLLEQVLADTISLVSLLPAVQRAHDELLPDDLLDLG